MNIGDGCKKKKKITNILRTGNGELLLFIRLRYYNIEMISVLRYADPTRRRVVTYSNLKSRRFYFSFRLNIMNYRRAISSREPL